MRHEAIKEGANIGLGVIVVNQTEKYDVNLKIDQNQIKFYSRLHITVR